MASSSEHKDFIVNLVKKNAERSYDESTAEHDIELKSIAEAKELLAFGVSDVHAKVFDKAIPSDTNHPIHHAAAHVYGGRALDEEATCKADRALKSSGAIAKLRAGRQVVISTDMVIGPSGPPYAIYADELIFNGGSLTIITTATNIVAKKLVIKNSSAEKSYHIAILGKKGASGEKGINGSNYTTSAGNGKDISPPSPGICTGASAGGNGSNGSSGGDGKPGQKGEDGIANLPASIFIEGFDSVASSAPFVVFTMSGAGGDGGNGGNGGDGQNAGRGGYGCNSGCEGTDGGHGGAGGAGGVGGAGGAGGNGRSGIPVAVSFPRANRGVLQTVSKSAAPGAGGDGGAGGGAGSGARGGVGGKHASDGAHGADSKTGSVGDQGKTGAAAGAPGNFSIHYLDKAKVLSNASK